ncbi:hypothetical protein KSF78_0008971 [Schistosoma japonicum]|nr:hypothetical protein KSF78_0008971 [Schistosoma japonicum]
MQLFTVMNISTVLLSLKLLTIKSQDVAETYVYETINITLLTIEFKDAWLWDYSINEMKPWNPEYNDSASLRYKELSNHMCQLVFNYTDDLVPTGSDEKKCDKVEFSPLKTAGDGDYALKVNATSTISYSYPHIISIDKETLRRNITSAFSHRGDYMLLRMLYYELYILTIEFKDAWLWDYSINEMKPWNPEYNDSASLRYKELSNHMCQLVFNYTDDLVPTGSDEKKCDKVEFSPLKTAGDGDYALKVNATSTISYSYPHIISIDKETLRRNITSAFSHRGDYMLLRMLYYELYIKTDVIPKKIPLKITVGEEITTKANPLDHSTTVLPPANTFANTRYNLLFTLQFYLSISLYFACTSLFALPVTVILLTTIVITYLLFNIKRHYLASDL